MKRMLATLVVAHLMAGCSRHDDLNLSAIALFNAKDNKELKASITPVGTIDKRVLLEGAATTPFVITVGVSGRTDRASGVSAAEILLEVRDGRLSPMMDWQTARGGDGPAMRREGDNQIEIYYPTVIENKRTWAKVTVTKK